MKMKTSRRPRETSITRRAFVQAGTATALTAAAWQRAHGANERIGVGIIGFGLIGRIHTRNFKAQPDVDVVAVAETYQPRREAAAALVGGNVTPYKDFRKLLERNDVDAVVVATPDHWHALMTMMACAAGKDVYVEKPLTLFVREGRWMVEAAKRHKRVVQVGTQARSAPHSRKVHDLIRSGYLGKIALVQCNYFRNVSPGFGNPPDQPPPPELDWNLWLGTAPDRSYNPNRAIYHFRWFWDYSGGQMTNLGQHTLDTVHQCLDLTAPKAVSSSGGRFFLKDNCEVPDTQDVIVEYPDCTAVCQYRECAAGNMGADMGGLMFVGTRGSLAFSRTGYQVFPDRKRNPVNIVAEILGGHPVGGPQPVPESALPEYWTGPLEDKSGDWKQQYVLHARNFLDCVKSRAQPAADLESGHRVATVCHLANISLRTGRKVSWDAEKEQIRGDAEANSMLLRPYRKPWDAVLRSLIAS